MAKKQKRTRRKAKDKRAYKFKLKKETAFSIVQVIFFLLSGLVVISFSRRGLLLIRLNDILMSLFGWSAIFLSFIFLSFAFVVSKYKPVISQPNVIIGSIVFFLSSAGLTRAGIIGRSAWLGMADLVTGYGSYLVYFASSVIGLVIMFNTSLDVVFGFFIEIWKKYIMRKPDLAKSAGTSKSGGLFKSLKKPELKVLGGSQSEPKINKPESLDTKKEDNKVEEPIHQKLVSNLPGEDIIWKYPPTSLLSGSGAGKADRGDIKNNAAVIEQTLESFGITARVVEVNLGPAVTQYAIEVALGTKLSKITALERDLALALAATTGTIRIEAPIPGRSLVGIELPNKAPEFVPLKRMLESPALSENKNKLAVALGLDVSGKPVVANIAKMPHILIAGQTGSGKSVCINAFLSSLLFRASPAEVKLILVDPKRVELTNYNNIPHLLAPVIVEPNKVVSALRWIMEEMDRRYKLFAQVGVRNIDGYNEVSGFQALPYIVLFIDELADIMLFSPVEVEDCITRIAQMSRATGIHMVLATQRPSVEVITGLIKANIPARIAFAVSSNIDSRVILDSTGADKLLGKGDMLFLPPEQAKPLRIQGAFLSDSEVNSLVSFLKNQGVTPQFTEEVTSMPKPGTTQIAGVDGDLDELFKDAVELAVQYDKASASLFQRRLSVGYARAARIIDQLEAAGVVSSADGSKPREVLISDVAEVLQKQSPQAS